MRLIDADALKENAREWFPKIVAHKSPFVVMGLFNLIDNLADNMPTIEQTVSPQWIYVDDEYPDGNLPNFGEPVLLCCEIYLKNPKVSVCYYMEIGTYEWDGEQNTGMWFVGDKQVYVSHWMPLPKFPEGYGR